jgi:hypothetical protein
MRRGITTRGDGRCDRGLRFERRERDSQDRMDQRIEAGCGQFVNEGLAQGRFQPFSGEFTTSRLPLRILGFCFSFAFTGFR